MAPETAKGRMVVVCDDGSVWKWIHDASRWDEMSPIPGSSRAAANPGPLPGGG